MQQNLYKRYTRWANEDFTLLESNLQKYAKKFTDFPPSLKILISRLYLSEHGMSYGEVTFLPYGHAQWIRLCNIAPLNSGRKPRPFQDGVQLPVTRNFKTITGCFKGNKKFLVCKTFVLCAWYCYRESFNGNKDGVVVQNLPSMSRFFENQIARVITAKTILKLTKGAWRLC